MTWVVAGLGVAIGLVVAAMFLLAGRRQPGPPVRDERCRILVRPAAPDPDVWAPEDWL